MDIVAILSDMVREAIGINAIVYALAAIGLNVHFGYTGLLNFGQSAFLAVASYGMAVTILRTDLPLVVSLMAGIAASVVLALLLGIPTLRLRADYLAIVTIAAAEIIRLLARSVALREYFGGSDGLQGFATGFYSLNPYPARQYGVGRVSFGEREMWAITVGWTLVAIACAIVFLLMRSPWGRVVKGIREDEDAVRSLGKDVYAYKMQALVIGGVLGALGGFVYALGAASIQPDIFGTETTFFAYTILILGGRGRVLRPGRRRDHLLGDPVAHRQSAAAPSTGAARAGPARPSFDIGACGSSSSGRTHAADHLPPAGDLRRQREIAIDAR
jgi:branched-chain amino acid transport system permease protein